MFDIFGLLHKISKNNAELERNAHALDTEGYKDEFIKYLEDKYQRKFLPIALYQEMEFLEFRAYPEGGDRKKDEIHLYMHDYATKNYTIEDNYFFETIRDEYDAYMKDVIKNYFTSFKVFYVKEHHYPRNLKLGDTWEYIRTHSDDFKIPFQMDIFIITDDVMDKQTFRKRFYELLLKLYNNNVHGFLSALNIKKGYLDKINDDNRREYHNSPLRKYEKIRLREESECIVKPERWDINRHK